MKLIATPIILIAAISACGSSGGPVIAAELEGNYCTADLGTCLHVSNRFDGSPILFEWVTPTCGENGELTGGLEFQPDGGGQCYGPPGTSLYSASVDWTDTGIRLFIDGERQPLDLWYRPCKSGSHLRTCANEDQLDSPAIRS